MLTSSCCDFNKTLQDLQVLTSGGKWNQQGKQVSSKSSLTLKAGSSPTAAAALTKALELCIEHDQGYLLWKTGCSQRLQHTGGECSLPRALKEDH